MNRYDCQVDDEALVRLLPLGPKKYERILWLISNLICNRVQLKIWTLVLNNFIENL
jgi:hypothetical protein